MTLVVAFTPSLHFAYRSEPAHLVFETADAAIAGAVALLLYGRFRRSQSLADLLLGYAMAMLCVAAVGFVTIPVLAGADPTDTVRTWAPLAIRVSGAVLFAAAALVSTGRVAVRRPRRDLGALATAVGVVLLASLLAPHSLPVAVDPTLDPEHTRIRAVLDYPLILAGQAAQFALYGIAAVAFTRRAVATADEFLSWIGAAAGFSAIARLNYMLFPSLFSEYVYVGDFLRTACYLTLLVGCAREIEQHWSAIATAAAIEERQRVARDLHDGLAQELTYIWSQLQQLERHPERDEVLSRVTSASARAIDEARRAIAALSRPIDEPLDQTLAQAAEEVAARYGARVELDLEPLTVGSDLRESIIRIVREAVGNAARHSGVDNVLLRLRHDDGLRLTVSDAGTGFNPQQMMNGHARGFGLTTMRQRAERTRGRFSVQSSPGAGTTVTVVWR